MSGICQTVKPGETCVFWKKTGCTYNGGTCNPVVEACEGCDRIKEYPSGLYCTSCSEPALKWKNGACNLATHVKKSNGNGSSKKLNPLKASKRMAAGR